MDLNDLGNLTPQQWGQLHHAADAAWAEAAAELGVETDHNGLFLKPKIEGGYSFDRAWDANNEIIQGAATMLWAQQYKETTNLGGLIHSSFYFLGALQQSHVITVHPEQVDALPDWEDIYDPVDYAIQAKLPFERIYIDCELPNQRAALSHDQLNVDFGMVGAVLAQHHVQDQTPDDIAVMPIGAMFNTETREPKVQTSSGRHDNILPYLPLGGVIYGESQRELKGIQAVPGNTMGVEFPAYRINLKYLLEALENHGTDRHYEDFTWDDHQPTNEPWPASVVIVPPARDQVSDHMLMSYSVALAMMAGRFINVLFFLDTPNIELVDAPVSRQARRQAERTGATISQTVFVRHSSKRYDSDPTDNKANYSHQFEVRGHWKYYPEGTQTAKARPDLLRYVPSRGMCRKIWCPPFVKGPEDKPLVLKTRRIREDGE